ncbi:unnamed protein product [Owenia fusiformis]|uniref:Sulfotransferase domain-containing protein n=1 Tax=Owenia fusiformis TaxID=6347 RepID=A0A8S4Q0H4_OWEFU|nr:unnamed protein product [Owenia fusiformis]
MRRRYIVAIWLVLGLTLMTILMYNIFGVSKLSNMKTTFGVSKRNNTKTTDCNCIKIRTPDEPTNITSRDTKEEKMSTHKENTDTNKAAEQRHYGEPGYVFVGTKRMNMFPKTVNQSDLDFSNYFSDAEVKKRNLVLLGGVMKCGTGTMKTFLKEHPSIRDAVGLQVFFTYNFGIQWYLKRLPKCKENEWAFTRCTNCFMNTDSLSLINNINELIGKRLKLLFIIRNPVERMISHYTQLKAGNKTLLPPIGHWIKEQISNPNTSGALQKTRYIDYFPVWYRMVGDKNILVLEHEEFVNTPWIAMQRVEKHLGLNPFFNENSFLLRKAGKYYCYKTKGPQMEECSHNPNSKGRIHVDITEKERTILRDYFRPFNERLFKFLNVRYKWE